MPSYNLKKIIISIGVGKLRTNAQFEEKVLPAIMKDLSLISGQKPAPRRAKKSIAGFKVRQGEVVGLMVTLRGRRMNDFLNRLINVVLPRLRDFRGIDLKNIDLSGNLSLGIKESALFPEIDQEANRVNFGVEVTLVSTVKNKKEGEEFYRSLNFPFKKQNG
ncbi:MAG TPA: 50S ribosomal protein L5 [Candidatus Tyrphobacter sp.]|nr:50S ribosomal protein L5 [Candidatus Tyrphobacter sp.]